MSQPVEPRNPFYLLLLIVGVLFVATALGYGVVPLLEEHAAKGAIFLHCLPGHWGQEATYELAHGAKSVIFDEAENRMWAQMALLLKILKIELVDNPKDAW